MYKGQLTGFPTEVVERMLDCQVEQGNKRDATVFESYKRASKYSRGFDWSNASEGRDFWSLIIQGENFDIFFERYPKQLTTNKMNVKQIIKDNNIKEVYSVMHGIDVSVDDSVLNGLLDDCSYIEGGECLIFPSKEERNWDRFKPKEPVYKPCESVEQFADLFLGAKVKHKTANEYKIIIGVRDESSPSYWFEGYTLLDGTPLGIKCEE